MNKERENNFLCEHYAFLREKEHTLLCEEGVNTTFFLQYKTILVN